MQECLIVGCIIAVIVVIVSLKFGVNIFESEFKRLKRANEPLYATPKSVQKTLEINKLSMSGLFDVGGGRFSKTYRFTDINYASTSDIDHIDKFTMWCDFLNVMDVPFKITINNKNKDMDLFAKSVLMEEKDDDFNTDRAEFNKYVNTKMKEGNQNLDQDKYLTITVNRKDIDSAKDYFINIEKKINQLYKKIGSKLYTLNGNDRLSVIGNFLHLGKEKEYSFNLEDKVNGKTDWKNDLCGSHLRYYENDFQLDDIWGRAFFIKSFRSSLDDDFLTQLSSLRIHSMVSVDVVPISRNIANSELKKKYMGVSEDIKKQQKILNKNNDFSSDISYNKRLEKEDIEYKMDSVRKNGESLMYVGVTLVVLADSRKSLKDIEEQLKTIAKEHNCVIDTHYIQQREALNTVMPIGVRQVETLRPMLTQEAATIIPFNVQEITDEDGFFYGINQVSKNVTTINRKKLMNGNGFILGQPGTGKSVDAKEEMLQVRLKLEKDEIIVIDPQNEYFDYCKRYNGSVLEFNNYANLFINPLQVDIDKINENDTNGIIGDKGELLLAICEQCFAPVPLNGRHKSIVDRCVLNIYKKAIECGINPIIEDFYNELLLQSEQEAKDIAISLERFVKGTYSLFNHQTNVDINNRFTVLGLKGLGENMRLLAMLIMMEFINNKVKVNAENGIATWVYIDEFHILLDKEYTFDEFHKLWKMIRKLGGLCTGITQNISDVLFHSKAATLLSNSEFILLLKQSAQDREDIDDKLEIDSAQLEFVKNSDEGTGLIKAGNKVVAFDNQMSKDTYFYNMFNTNFHEKNQDV